MLALALQAVGAALVVVGVALVSVPAALMVAGVACGWVGWLVDR